MSFRNYSRLLTSIRGWLLFAASSVVLAIPALAALPIKNVVLAHGAFVDGSGWQPVYAVVRKVRRCLEIDIPNYNRL